MKNLFKNILSGVLFAELLSANSAFAFNLKSLSEPVSNYTLVLFGIVFFTVMLFVGLSLYNRFFVSQKIKDYKLNRYSLADSTDEDDAVLTYITKNKLR